MSRFSDIRDGLMASGLFLLLLLLLITPLSLISVWFLPLPFLLVTARNGWHSVLFSAALCSFFSLLFTGQPLFLLLVFFSVMTGGVMGFLYRKETSTGTDVALGGLVAAWVGLLLSGLAVAFFTDVLAHIQTIWREQWEMTQEMFRSAGVDEPFDPDAVKMVIPGVSMLFTLPFPLLNLVLGRRLLMRKGLPGKYLLLFRKWRLPRGFFYFYLLSLVVLLLFSESESVGIAFGNIVIVLYLLFFIQGLAFTVFLLHRFQRGKGWAFAAVFLSFLLPPVMVAVHFLGILDTGTAIRNRLEEKR
ncbi:DUF2232 domain-containing protein [Paludifilum halophilum]|uniref:DUF2232 domain-containing protein n=1 Tax=Paludifilum halophilum TaxID=1642702 RepID=A0A235B6M1_9BACL|nr:DUF2232 domain-containing protein [Paludifilum halophilum]OYD07940.1 hypothetical protein CHM34_07395 [Paludifilum halophilum]